MPPPVLEQEKTHRYNAAVGDAACESSLFCSTDTRAVNPTPTMMMMLPMMERRGGRTGHNQLHAVRIANPCTGRKEYTAGTGRVWCDATRSIMPQGANRSIVQSAVSSCR